MRFLDVLCYVLFVTSITAPSVLAKEKKNIENKATQVKKLAKRETVVLDSYPVETKIKPQNILYMKRMKNPYKPRANRFKYSNSKTKHVMKPYLHSKSKHYNYNKHNFRKANIKKSPMKLGLAYHYNKNVALKKRPLPLTSGYYAKQTRFAEPPIDFEHHPNKHIGKPIVNSYGEPIKHPQYHYGFDDQINHYEHNIPNHSQDDLYTYAKLYPSFKTSDLTPIHSPDNNEDEYNEEFTIKSYPGIQNYGKNEYTDDFESPHKYTKQLYQRIKKPGDSKDHIVVGGQYAEPPGRYVPKFQPSAPMVNGNDGEFGLHKLYDSVVAGANSISSYVNYKNSNMAFSPQNLNDAFSIVD